MAPKKTRLTPDDKAYDAMLSMPGAVKASDITSDLTPEELEVLKAFRDSKNTPKVAQAPAGVNELVNAFVQAINITKPREKVRPYQRKRICKECGQDHKDNTPLKRAWLQHGGFDMLREQFCNSTIELLNRVKPGVYINGLVKVHKRKDRAYDITWPVRTQALRQRVMDEAAKRTGLGNSLDAILQACIDEQRDPRRFRGPDDDDD